jgi:hypothetical protein
MARATETWAPGSGASGGGARAWLESLRAVKRPPAFVRRPSCGWLAGGRAGAGGGGRAAAGRGRDRAAGLGGGTLCNPYVEVARCGWLGRDTSTDGCEDDAPVPPAEEDGRHDCSPAHARSSPSGRSADTRPLRLELWPPVAESLRQHTPRCRRMNRRHRAAVPRARV